MDKLQEILFRAADSISRLGFGSIVSHDAMASFVETQAGTPIYYARVNTVREILMIQHHIFLETQFKTGYSLVEPGSEINQCEGKFLKGLKQQYKAVAYAAHIDMDRITDAQKRTATIEKSQKMAALTGMIKHGLAFGQSESLPA